MSVNSTGGNGLYSQLYWREGDGYSYWVQSNLTPDQVWIYRRKDTAALPTTGQDPYIKGGSSATWEGRLNTSVLPSTILDLFITSEGSIALTGSYSYYGSDRSCVIQGSRKVKKTLDLESLK